MKNRNTLANIKSMLRLSPLNIFRFHIGERKLSKLIEDMDNYKKTQTYDKSCVVRKTVIEHNDEENRDKDYVRLYDVNSNLIEERTKNRQTSIRYDKNGNMETKEEYVINARGIAVDYDASLITSSYHKNGEIKELVMEDVMGFVSSIFGENNEKKSTYRYDTKGREIYSEERGTERVAGKRRITSSQSKITYNDVDNTSSKTVNYGYFKEEELVIESKTETIRDLEHHNILSYHDSASDKNNYVATFDKEGRETSFRKEDGTWRKSTYNEFGLLSSEDSDGRFEKSEYTDYGLVIGHTTHDSKKDILSKIEGETIIIKTYKQEELVAINKLSKDKDGNFKIPVYDGIFSHNGREDVFYDASGKGKEYMIFNKNNILSLHGKKIDNNTIRQIKYNSRGVMETKEIIDAETHTTIERRRYTDGIQNSPTEKYDYSSGQKLPITSREVKEFNLIQSVAQKRLIENVEQEMNQDLNVKSKPTPVPLATRRKPRM